MYEVIRVFVDFFSEKKTKIIRVFTTFIDFIDLNDSCIAYQSFISNLLNIVNRWLKKM